MWGRAYAFNYLRHRLKKHAAELSIKVDDEADTDNILEVIPTQEQSPEEIYSYNEQAQLFKATLKARARKAFSNPEARKKALAIAIARLSGRTLADIAKEFGVSRQRIEQFNSKMGLSVGVQL
jgi:DNA-directed RNA polymerase sigma subunit (sigma70/sigma32)